MAKRNKMTDAEAVKALLANPQALLAALAKASEPQVEAPKAKAKDAESLAAFQAKRAEFRERFSAPTYALDGIPTVTVAYTKRDGTKATRVDELSAWQAATLDVMVKALK